MLLIQTAYQKVKGLGLPCAVVLGILGGVLCWTYERTVQASGLKQGGGSARRAVSASGLSSGHQHHIFKEPSQNAENRSSGCRAVFSAVMHRTATPGAQVVTVGRFLACGIQV